MHTRSVSRRSFLATSALAPLALASPPAKKIPIGLELYSVREALAKDLMGTVHDVAKMGYEAVEFYSPYFEWTTKYAKEVRAMLDELGIRCYSTHNDSESFTAEGLKKAAELNQIIGSKYIVWASAGSPGTMEGWKGVAATLTKAAQTLAPLNLQPGYHNHSLEFHLMNGQRPIDIIASNTPKDVMMQLDVGHCVEGSGDPVAWIKAHPGRVRSLHCKDWNSGKGFQVLIGEGDVPWPRVAEAAETVGGVEFYLVEQEGSRFSEMETAERSLIAWKKARVQF